MQDEVSQRVVTLCAQGLRLTANMLAKMMERFLVREKEASLRKANQTRSVNTTYEPGKNVL